MAETDFVGVGLKFPLIIDVTGKAELVSGEELIKQSLTEIYSEKLAQRFLLGQFGSAHHKYQFSQLDDALRSALNTELYLATLQEKRVRYLQTSFEQVGVNQINCTVQFVILRTNKTGTLVYPFFIEFAT